MELWVCQLVLQPPAADLAHRCNCWCASVLVGQCCSTEQERATRAALCWGGPAASISCREMRPDGSNGFFKTKIVGRRKIAFKFSVALCFLAKFMVFYSGCTFLEDVFMLYQRSAQDILLVQYQ